MPSELPDREQIMFDIIFKCTLQYFNSSNKLFTMTIQYLPINQMVSLTKSSSSSHANKSLLSTLDAHLQSFLQN